MKSRFWIYLVLYLPLILLKASDAKSATYNFFFNNAEQGDNSTAKPALTVNGDKNSKEDDSEEPEDPKAPKANSAPAPAPAISAQRKDQNKESDRKFRVMLGFQRNSSVYPEQDISGRSTRENINRNDSAGFGLVGSLGFFPIRYAGIKVFGGTHSAPIDTIFGAVELEVVPIATRYFDLGLLGGLWTLPRYESVQDKFDPSIFGQKYESRGMGGAYAGLSLLFRLHDYPPARVAWIANVEGRANAQYFDVNAGIGLAF